MRPHDRITDNVEAMETADKEKKPEEKRLCEATANALAKLPEAMFVGDPSNIDLVEVVRLCDSAPSDHAGRSGRALVLPLPWVRCGGASPS